MGQGIVFRNFEPAVFGRMITSSQGLYLNTGQHKHRINIYTYRTSMPCVGFEPMIPVSERAKTVQCLDRSATVTDLNKLPETKCQGKLRFMPGTLSEVYSSALDSK
jgi:hypothetical protein